VESCPGCSAGLVTVQGPAGVIYACNGCGGRAITLAVLRKRHDQKFLQDLWGAARSAIEVGKRACPACTRRMCEVELLAESDALHLDVCKTCFVVYFDEGEVERLPRSAADYARETKQLSPEGKRALAMMRLEEIQADADRKEAKRELESISIFPSRYQRTPESLIEALAQIIVAVVRGLR
jgi:Zn-finger nucleic acid-binding protein